MTETTLQFVIKVFSVVMGVIILAVVGTFIFIIVRDGSESIVSQAFDSLVTFGQWATGILGAVIVGKPVLSGIGNMMQASAAQKNANATSTLASSASQVAQAVQTVPSAQSNTANLPQSPI